MLNKAKDLNLILGFCKDLNYDFNHLMYADDLILVTSATRRAARNIQLCMSIYYSLSGQKPNNAKSEIFFPVWLNKDLPTSSIKFLISGKVPSFHLLRGSDFSQEACHFSF